MAPKCRVTSPIRRELASCRFLVRGELLPESGALYPFPPEQANCKTPRFQVRKNVKNPARNILRCNTQSRYGISQTGRFRPHGTVGAGPGVQRHFSANRERLSNNTLLSWGSASS